MTQLNQLMDIPGMLGAIRFLDDGSVDESIGSIDPEHAVLAAELCFANTRIAQQQGDLLVAFTGLGGWSPPRGWAMAGPEISVCGMASVACFVSNKEISYNTLFTVLYRVAHA
ncbi:DUF2173 family protein [Thermithiobacillus plumbiphilus]|uniref:DUF2173 family protein n=1 Tax=Thermithiobacillus plumbiphilus TaxID=1729899 RepID=A0ABU9DB71_9PROT